MIKSNSTPKPPSSVKFPKHTELPHEPVKIPNKSPNKTPKIVPPPVKLPSWRELPHEPVKIPKKR